MNRWYDEHFREYSHDIPVSEERDEQLRKESQEAQAALSRRLFSEMWLIPDHIAGRIDLALVQMDAGRRYTDWHAYLDDSGKAMSSLITDLQRMIRRDLGFEGLLSPLWRKLRFYLFTPRRYRQIVKPPA
jgi:hypothetical protein